jgi:2-oxoacid:acceptor oxidoreductase delta subunit (pyruvate/2-ketoisovalerate family)
MRPEDKPYVELGTTFSRGPIGVPVTNAQIEILKMLFSPEEARVAASLDYVPEPEEIIAARAGVAPEVAADLLTRMASRSLIRGVRQPDGVRVFRLLLFIPGLFEMAYINPNPSVDMEKLGDLLERYFHEGWGRALHGHGVPIARALAPLGPPKERVLPHEDAVKLVEQAPFAVLVNCSCREAVRKCDCPIDICIGLGQGVLGGTIEGAPVSDPGYAVGPPQARIISIDEAVHTLQRAEEAGLCHLTLNFREDAWLICNCCSHACFLVRGACELDIPHSIAPTSFWSVVEKDDCIACGACEPACPMRAIKLDDESMPEIDYERCLGCGVCVHTCPTDAIRLEKRGDEIYTPYLDYNELVAALGRTQAVHAH